MWVPVLVRVRGRSMRPTYAEGDVLLVARGARARPGDAAVVALPPDRHGSPRGLAVKRIRGRDPEDATRWWIDSDNPAEGVTSFEVGSLPDDAIAGRVLARVRRG